MNFTVPAMCLKHHILRNTTTSILTSFLKTFTLLQNQTHSFLPHYKTHVINYHTSPYEHKYNDNVIKESNKLITNYIRSGDLSSGLKVFESMPHKTTVTWNSILSGFAKNPGKVVEARKVVDEIPKPDFISCNTMLLCYVNNDDMKAAWMFFREMGFRDIASWNTMI